MGYIASNRMIVRYLLVVGVVGVVVLMMRMGMWWWVLDWR
jgi:hypothetical protein